MVRWYLPAKMKIMDIMVVNPEIRAEKRSNFRVIKISPGIAFSVILKILQLLILSHSQLQEMQKSAKVRVMPINSPMQESLLPEKETLLPKKQALKFFRQL